LNTFPKILTEILYETVRLAVRLSHYLGFRPPPRPRESRHRGCYETTRVCNPLVGNKH